MRTSTIRSVCRPAAPTVLTAVFFLLSVFWAPGCLAAGQLRVAAASSVTFPMKEIAAGFEKETGAEVTLVFGSTGKLSYQLSHGAPFDLFFAADTGHVDELASKGHLDPESVTVYATGRLALVSNPSSGVEVKGLGDLLSPGIRKIALANPGHAPYGMAAREALRAAGLWARVKPKVVYGENVRQAMVFVETGNAEAALVALSLVRSPKLDVIPVDPSLHPPIEQAAGVSSASTAKDLAKEFLDYTGSVEAARVWQEYGFRVPDGG